MPFVAAERKWPVGRRGRDRFDFQQHEQRTTSTAAVARVDYRVAREAKSEADGVEHIFFIFVYRSRNCDDRCESRLARVLAAAHTRRSRNNCRSATEQRR